MVVGSTEGEKEKNVTVTFIVIMTQYKYTVQSAMCEGPIKQSGITILNDLKLRLTLHFYPFNLKGCTKGARVHIQYARTHST